MGTSFVNVDNRKIRLKDDCFLITNAGQNYTLEIDEKLSAETFNVHFGERFADDLIQSQSLSVEKIFDQAENSSPVFSFHNRLMRRNEKINQLIAALKTNRDELREAELLSDLFIELLHDELHLHRTIIALPSLKKSTRDELVKKILLSVDYIHEFYNQSLSLDELARVSCLSKFHFLRLFKMAMRQTPHQFINRVRIEKSKELLSSSKLEVKHIADSVGFSDSSSFSRAFYQHVGAYPSQFRA
jgi:AraC family transcriptional regulator